MTALHHIDNFIEEIINNKTLGNSYPCDMLFRMYYEWSEANGNIFFVHHLMFCYEMRRFFEVRKVKGKTEFYNFDEGKFLEYRNRIPEFKDFIEREVKHTKHLECKIPFSELYCDYVIHVDQKITFDEFAWLIKTQGYFFLDNEGGEMNIIGAKRIHHCLWTEEGVGKPCHRCPAIECNGDCGKKIPAREWYKDPQCSECCYGEQR